MTLSDIVSGFVMGRTTHDSEDSDMASDREADFDEYDVFEDLGGLDDGLDELREAPSEGDGELRPRLEELEEEMDRISTTMDTVRSENETIRETVGDIEDNVRKLLEIYEMVTHEVNPFVDENEELAGQGDGIDLFGDTDWDDGQELDFDSDLSEVDGGVGPEDGWGSAESPMDSSEGRDNAALVGDRGTPGEKGEGKTFEDLKSEYADGAASWDEDPDSGTGIDRSTPSAASDDPTDDEGGGEDQKEPAVATGPSTPDEKSTTSSVPVAEEGKPYLSRLPDGYAADLLVMEWLSFLRSCSNIPESLRAIRYYETIGWVGPTAAESLTQYLSGMSMDDSGRTADSETHLTIDHHTRSLWYIGKLGGTEIRPGRLKWTEDPSGGLREEGETHHGIQR